MPTLDQLVADPSRAMNLSTSETTLLLVQAGGLEAVLRALLATARRPDPVTKPPTPEKPRDRFLTLDEAVERSHLSRSWFHTHWRKTFPTAVKKGRRILFPESEFERWLRQR
jgi:predicted DNA-binding transcriptional regulator AlpA